MASPRSGCGCARPARRPTRRAFSGVARRAPAVPASALVSGAIAGLGGAVAGDGRAAPAHPGDRHRLRLHRRRRRHPRWADRRSACAGRRCCSATSRSAPRTRRWCCSCRPRWARSSPRAAAADRRACWLALGWCAATGSVSRTRAVMSISWSRRDSAAMLAHRHPARLRRRSARSSTNGPACSTSGSRGRCTPAPSSASSSPTSGSPWLGLPRRSWPASPPGLLMGLLTVTLGVNQHVAGIGITLLLVAACDFTNRLLYSTGQPAALAEVHALVRRSRRRSGQYPLTYVGFLVAGPAAVVGAAVDRDRLAAARRGREPRGGRRGRHLGVARPATSACRRRRADGGRRCVPDPRRCSARFTLDIVSGRGLGVHRAGDLRPVAGVADGGGRAALRGHRRAAAPAGDHRPVRATCPASCMIAAALPRGDRRARGVGPRHALPGAYLTPYRRA